MTPEEKRAVIDAYDAAKVSIETALDTILAALEAAVDTPDTPTSPMKV